MRATTVNSIWLREEGENNFFGRNRFEKQSGQRSWHNQGSGSRINLNSNFRINLEGSRLLNAPIQMQDSRHFSGNDSVADKSQQVGSSMKKEVIRSGPNAMGISTRLDLTRIDCELEEEPISNDDGKKKTKTKLNNNRMEKVRRRCGYFNGVDVPTDGSRGGLCIGWNGEEEESFRWRFTGFYGAPNVREKAKSWNLLRRLGQNNSLPWLVGGDFNDILYANEKQGGVVRDENRMNAFRKTLDDCQLEDIGFAGPEESCEDKIRKLWKGSSGDFLNRLTNLANGLKMWARRIKEQTGRNVKSLTRRLEILNEAEKSEEVLADLVDVKLHLNMEVDKEERYWEQRARVNWLKMGDRNTSFFHKFASQRRRINHIRGLLRDDGSLATDSVETEIIARDYFSDLFASRGVGNFDHILSGVQRSISERVNQSLMASFTEEEIIEAIKGMGPTKSSGLDGFPAIFYQRLITDNVLLAYEVLHSFKYKRIGRKSFMALKLDMSKAYDRVEWPFLKAGPSFTSTRGLRQWDPLSPYMFLFCGEGLSALMHLASQERRILGAKVNCYCALGNMDIKE
ncbi:hypothetical protein J1N35_015479 [Gossypium stocksii]|uniref:Reverse transcriptase n=1 Tax=Gossypium stocksii TaxID=47602 RepID=A0A9D3VWT3_9ROSI|nr:hypothetical protein J1N35_015479 [Gossypium stocksii]